MHPFQCSPLSHLFTHSKIRIPSSRTRMRPISWSQVLILHWSTSRGPRNPSAVPQCSSALHSRTSHGPEVYSLTEGNDFLNMMDHHIVKVKDLLIINGFAKKKISPPSQLYFSPFFSLFSLSGCQNCQFLLYGLNHKNQDSSKSFFRSFFVIFQFLSHLSQQDNIYAFPGS